MPNTKLGFLLGAGVSLACRAPSTQELTEVVLRSENVHRYSDGTYFLSANDYPGLADRGGLERIRCFLSFLYSRAEEFFRQRKQRVRVVNYEDLYYLVTQLADAVDEFENPAITHLLHEVERSFTIPRLPPDSTFRSSRLLHETRHYVKGIVAHSLAVLKPTAEHLRPVVQAAKDRTVSRLEIFTLNHDLLIERVLKDAGIRFETGFASVSEDLSCWDRKKFIETRKKVRVGKLHGSVDWYPMRFSKNGPSCVCIATNGDINHARGPNRQEPELLEDRPEMLIGTFNKMLEYTMGIYADLFCAFRAALWALDRLVISGYSFGDKGINASITEWVRQDPERRILIVAPCASRYRRTARGAIRRLFEDCRSQIKMRADKFEEVDWDWIRIWCQASN